MRNKQRVPIIKFRENHQTPHWPRRDYINSKKPQPNKIDSSMPQQRVSKPRLSSLVPHLTKKLKNKIKNIYFINLLSSSDLKQSIVLKLS